MVYKLVIEAEKTWQRLHCHQILEQLLQGVEFIDGEVKKVA